jgi:hypothetical protein
MGQENMDLRRNNARSRRSHEEGGNRPRVNNGAARSFRKRKSCGAVRLKIRDVFVGKGEWGEAKKDNDQQGRQIPVQKTPQPGRESHSGRGRNYGLDRLLQFKNAVFFHAG